MKSVFFIFIFLSLGAYAEEIRTYKKINSSQAEVVIQTEEQDGTQAAAYVDGKENEQFIMDIMKDKTSSLHRLRREIEKENCEVISSDSNGHIDGCGEVELTSLVLTSFGRGGWDSGGAAYTFFIGFRSDGSGRFYDVTHMVTISESVLAQTTSDGDYAGKIIKILNFGKITRIDERQPFTK